jgi:glycosyltransferase involved in cell wall biosynthesis
MPKAMSAVMIVRDGAKTIQRSLQSLVNFDDVVVYDNGSCDGTQEIARSFVNVRVIEGAFVGFGLTKNVAIEQALHDWILVIDADEVLEPELSACLLQTEFDPNSIYRLNFKAYYKERQIRYCGWNNQKIRRVFHRKQTRFNANHVHEDLLTDGMRIEDLVSGSIRHYSYHSISDFIAKVDRYSTLFAESNKGKRASSPAKAFFNGLYSFIRTYFFKRGFLDGYPGLVIAFSHMATNFYKYIKLYEANRES